MSTLHSMKKQIAKRSLLFDPGMYINLLGSVVISAYILSEEKPDVAEINKMWRFVCKHKGKVDFWIDDEAFIDKALDLFNIKRPEPFPVAMVQDKFNVLVMPYIDGQLFPLREDGVYPRTAKEGKIYPINFGSSADDEVVTKSEEKDNA